MTTTSEQVGKAPPRSARNQNRLIGIIGRIRELGLLVVLLVIVLIVSVQVPRFLSVDNIEQILLSVAIIAIVAVGETLVVLTRNVDLSVGSIVGITAFIVASIFKQHPGTSVFSALLLGCLLGVALGIINGLLVTLGRVPAIVATLGTLYVYRGFDFVIAGGSEVNASDVPDSYLNLATARILGVPALIIYAAIIALILAYFLRFSRLGRQLYAIGSNPEAARIVGIRSDALVFGAFVLSGLLCGLAGVLWGSRFGTVDARAATGFEFEVIAAVVVGGVNIFGGSGTVLGTILGAIVLGTIDDALTILKLSQFWLQAIDGAAILTAVTLDLFIVRWVQRVLVAGRRVR
ncbi:MAG: ABC transporter permease [Ktedonobacteraceae bacterium]